VLGVFWFPPTKADTVVNSEFSQVVGIPMAGSFQLIEDVPVILFSDLVSDEF
jgi:hypothetical protein